MTEKRAYHRGTIARWLLAGAVLACAMGLGGLSRWVLLAVLALVSAAVVFAWGGSSLEGGARRAATALLGVGAILCAFTAFQMLPLPLAWVRGLASANGEIWARSLSAFREPGPAMVSLSVDPIATGIELVRGFIYLLAFLAALRLSERREGMRFLSSAMIAVAALLGLSALLHPALGAERVFGVYAPQSVRSARHLAPILNPNALADFINIGFALAFSELIAKTSPIPRAVTAAMAILLAAVQFWIASRGGLIGMFLAVLLLFWIHHAARESRAGVRPAVLLLGIVAVASLAMIVLASSTEAFDEVADTDYSKLWMHRQMVPLLRVFPAFGMGRGAFESVYPAFRSFGTGYMVFNHPENVILQWMIEWGILVGGAGLVMVAWALRPATALARRTETFGAWAAIAVVAVHNLFDLGTEIPANMLALSICGGIIASGSGQVRAKMDTWRTSVRAIRLGSVALAAIGAAVLVSHVGHDLHEEREHIRSLAVDPSVEKPAFYSSLRAAILRHPAEPFFPYLGALRSLASPPDRIETTTAWVARTLERSPVHGPAHLVLARALPSRAPAQSRVEYRIAVTQEPAQLSALYETGPLIRSYDDAVELIPLSGPARSGGEPIVAELIRKRLPAAAWRLDQLVVAEPLNEPAIRAFRARTFVSDVLEPAPFCEEAKDACFRRANEEVERLIQLRPARCEGYSLRVDLALQGGTKERAFSDFLKEVDRVEDRSECLSQAILRAQKTKAKEETALIDQLARAGCTSVQECASNLMRASDFEANAGRATRAFAFLKAALEKDPGNDALTERSAVLASQLGMHRESADLFKRLFERNPDRADLRVAREREERASAVGTLPR